MTFSEAKAALVEIDANVARAGASLRDFPKTGPMGLTPDAVKSSPAYRQAKAEFDRAFHDLQTMNRYMMRNFAKELCAERSAIRQSQRTDRA